MLVREGNAIHGSPILNPECAYELVKDELESSDRERFVVILLDAKNRPIGIEEASVGDLTSSLVHPREVFKSAILANAYGIIAVHNHPSGVLNPSNEDLDITRRLKEVGELMGIKLLDHIIIGGGCFLSMMDCGIIKKGGLVMKTQKERHILKEKLEKSIKVPVCMVQDEIWPERMEMVNESLVNIVDVLELVKDLEDESLAEMVKTIHLFTSRAIIALNFRKDVLLEMIEKNESGELFKQFMEKPIPERLNY